MRIIDCFFTPYIESEVKKITKEEIQSLENMISEIFFFAMVWSIGATTNLAGRIKFD